MSEFDYARVRSQYATDSYSLIVSKNELARRTLKLKQLLELNLDQDLQVTFPVISDSLVLQEIPEEAAVYRKALEIMPEIAVGRVSVQSAQLGLKLANAGYWPVFLANAVVGTGYNTLSADGFGLQMGHGLNGEQFNPGRL